MSKCNDISHLCYHFGHINETKLLLRKAIDEEENVCALGHQCYHFMPVG